MTAEEELLEPVKICLREKFAQFGECELEITKAKITEKAKAWLDDPALFFIRVQKRLPDMIGRFKPDPTKKSPYSFYEGLIIVEVKNEEPSIKAIYQTKLYAEVFDATHPFLISSKAMIEEMRRFLSKRFSLLSYFGGYRRVHIGRFDTRTMTVEWYAEDPFKVS